MLALTATASKKNIAKIKQLLALKEPAIYEASPDRPNIRMFISKVQPRAACLDWLVSKLKVEKNKCEKTIVYCRRFKDCSSVYMHFTRGLGKNPSDMSERLYDMVHSKNPDSVKTHVIQSLMDQESNLRVVIATKVVGLGIDVRCQTVVNFGSPNSVDDYLQQIGRAGKTGEQSHAVLMYSAQQLRNIDASMLVVLKNNDSCIRELCLNEFGQKKGEFAQGHLCCNICAVACKCGHCEFSQEEDIPEEEEEGQLTRAVSSDSIQQLFLELS